jgi:hypothetical protein
MIALSKSGAELPVGRKHSTAPKQILGIESPPFRAFLSDSRRMTGYAEVIPVKPDRTITHYKRAPL